MSESIDSMRRATIEVVDLPTDKLDPDPVNPNRVPPRLLKALARTIEEDGFVQPVVVRPGKGGRYTIVDGEHRWRLLRDADVETVPAIIDDAGDDEGRMRLLSMNALRGKPDPIRRARVLAHLAEQLDEAELAERLGMEPEEFDAAVELKDAADGLADDLMAALEREAKEAPEVLRFRMGPRQAQSVEKALQAEQDNGAKTRADALIRILSA